MESVICNIFITYTLDCMLSKAQELNMKTTCVKRTVRVKAKQKQQSLKWKFE